MGKAKGIVLRPISQADAARVIIGNHYSGRIVQNSTLHIGVFQAGRLEGAMQFGSPLDRRKMLPLVRGTGWNEMLELNRMAFSDRLPRNAESRAMSIAFRMIKKHRPDIRWILSFSDATQCGDGAIYRAAGFLLTAIKKNKDLLRFPSGRVVHSMTIKSSPRAIIPEAGRSFHQLTGGGSSMRALCEATGAKPLDGYQLRYIKFLDPAWADRLTVPVIPFDEIPAEARMYRGIRRQPVEGVSDQDTAGGADPTLALHLTEHHQAPGTGALEDA